MKSLLLLFFSFMFWYGVFLFFTGTVNPLEWNIWIKILVFLLTMWTYKASYDQTKDIFK